MDDYRQQALLAIETLRERVRELEQANNREPIAIVGYAARFPGAPDAEAFWELLEEGRDAVTEIPPDRWDVDAFYDPDPDVPGKMVTRRAGFIDDVSGFDAQFFGISPREATYMDPQHRLMLEVAWHALEHAGMPPADLKGSRTGIWMGLNTHEYLGLLIGNMTYESIDIYSATGTSPAAGVGRINYRLGLEGPAVIIDTACSSSLVAIHQASQALRSGECDMALAGGVNIILSPVPMINFSKVRMLSPDGRCKTFDAAADGYVRGEGCGAIVMKRLSDAIRDGDQVRAIIRGSAMNQDGASGGLTVPNGRAQQRVIADALKSAGVEPKDIDYLEAHGTGTSLGDPIEVQAAAAALGIDRDKPLLIGSAKTNIGHLEAAAGIVGVIKVVMSLEHELLPKHLHFQTPSPHMPWDRIPVEVVREATPWKIGDRPRIAGVSSFGFSGTNAHVVIEEAPVRAEAPEPASDARRYAVIPLSARTPEALKTLASSYVSRIESAAGLALPDLAYTAGAGRSHLEHRTALVIDSLGRVRRLLDAFAEDQPSAGAFTGSGTEPPKTAWLFTGQGSQYAGMAKELYESQPVFREVLDHCQEMLRGEMELPLLDVIFGEEAGISQTANAQPALFAVEMALARLWQHWGLEPDVILGHSVGQYAAACVAGVFSLEDGLKLLARRGKLMGALPEGGSMAAVFADAAAVEEQVAQYPLLSIAAYNGAHIVVSGPSADVASLVAAFQSREVRCEPLDTSHAFHSALLEPMLDEFERYAGEFSFEPLQRTLVCNRTGKVLTSQSQLDASYWRRQARQPVQFAESVKTLSELGCKVLLEVGPQPVLTAMALRAWPEDAPTPKAVASLRKDQPDSRQIMEALAQLYVAGARPDFAAVDGHISRHKIDLPRYPFEHKPFWFTPTRFDPYAMQSAPVAGSTSPVQIAAWAADVVEPEVTFEADGDAWLRAIPPEEREERLGTFLRAELARALGVSEREVDPDELFITMGMDSLMAIDLRSHLQGALAMSIPATTLIYSCPNITSLTKVLLELWTDTRVNSNGHTEATSPVAVAKSDASWLIESPGAVDPDLHLVCFSHAGGGASMFHGWRTALGSGIGVYALQLPGHENRFGEPFATSIKDVIEAAVRDISALGDRPLVLFGHSMGSLIAYEVAQELRRRGGPTPRALFVSSFAAPHLPGRIPPISHLPPAEIVELVGEQFEGIPDLVRTDPELMEITGRMLAADFAIVEQHVNPSESPLDCPIYAFGGADDILVGADELEGWRQHTTGDFSCELFPGDHFYLRTPVNQQALLTKLHRLSLGEELHTS